MTVEWCVCRQVLEDAGCVFQERQGWERPAWFGEGVAPVQEYDWYGAYNTPLSADQRYNDSINGDCSFDFPAHHDLVNPPKHTMVYFDTWFM